jgi:hypothetical protein
MYKEFKFLRVLITERRMELTGLIKGMCCARTKEVIERQTMREDNKREDRD